MKQKEKGKHVIYIDFVECINCSNFKKGNIIGHIEGMKTGAIFMEDFKHLLQSLNQCPSPLPLEKRKKNLNLSLSLS